MFQSLSEILSLIRLAVHSSSQGVTPLSSPRSPSSPANIPALVESLVHKTIQMTSHLNTHLLKEETECMPLISQTLTQAEMTELVGDIMGTRSSSQMREIMTLAVNELPRDEQEAMVSHMNKAMEGTFFEKW